MTGNASEERKPAEHDIGTIALCRWLSGYALRRWPGLVAVFAVMFVGIGINILQPWPMKLLVDNVLNGAPLPPLASRILSHLPWSDTPHHLLAWCVAGMVILFLLTWAVTLVSTYIGIGFGERLVYDLAADLFIHLQRLSLRFHHRKRVGDTIRRVTSDCACVSTIVRGALLPVITSAFTLIAMFTVMWKLNSTLTLLALAVVPFMIVVFRVYAEPLLERSYEQQEIEGRFYDLVEETLSAIPAVQAFGRENDTDRRMMACTDANMTALLRATHVQMKFKVLIGLATAMGTAGILWIGARQVLEGGLTLGGILVFLSYLGSLYEPLNALMYTSSTIQGAAGSARRVMEILATERDVNDRPGAVVLPPAKGRILIDNVTFGYEQDRPFLRGVSLEALPGETVAIVGATGAGKTTLVGMVPRFFDPWEGCVTVDGHDIRGVQLQSLRSQIALVLQEPFLFPISIAENIAYGRPEATRQEIEAAARAANAHPFIGRLSGGYDTVIGERGATLSGGERQRLSIARALLKDAPILIMDEPTSALDAETESMLLEALRRLMQGRTTLIIAHRLSTIRDASRIVVMQSGVIAESGTHGELLKLGGLYAHLCSVQFGRHDQSLNEDMR